MKLIVAEKPSVARDIARVLQCKKSGDWYESADYRVTWALGHLVTFVEPDEIDPRYKKWRKEDLPILPGRIDTKVIPRTRAQFGLVKKLMLDKQTRSLICATDAGREGELIFRLIYEQAGCNKPVERLWISSLTDAAIREGFAALKPAKEYQGLSDSALCRAQADWLVGMNASRAFTLQYGALLSVGRVQTPTLAILVERGLEIRNFKPETFFTLTANFGDYQGQWFDPGAAEERTAHRISSKEEAEAIRAQVKGGTARVDSAQTQPRRELPPQLFDLTSLQREANRVLGFTADRTLKTSQGLYEARKALTYPRTDSRYLPTDMIPRVNQALARLPDSFQQLALGIPRQEGKLPFSRRVFDNARVSDHHAIIPTPTTPDLSRFTADERALYNLVARRFIAAFYPPFEYEATTVITRVGTQAFKSQGRVVTREGWKAVEPPAARARKEDGEAQAALPALQVGDERQVVGTRVKQDSTKPPPPHTEASLLARMERPGMQVEDEELMETLKKAGLGTPATRAAIIERLLQVGYATRRGKALFATDKGEKLITVVPEDIASPVLTGKWEQALEEIVQQRRDPRRFMDSIKKLTTHLVNAAFTQKKEVVFERELRTKSGRVRAVSAAKTLEGLSCPLCGQPLQESDRAFGCSDWKNGCGFTLWKNALLRAKGPFLNEPIIRLLLTTGQARGSSGLITLREGQLGFTPTGQSAPTLQVPIRYQKAQRPAVPGKPAAKPRTRKPKP
ncbi:MAG: DNA topoisomerase 3 [Clostridiales bacterium]|nr:DNA topoisomerase 3 [Clostridiales bacterium]